MIHAKILSFRCLNIKKLIQLLKNCNMLNVSLFIVEFADKPDLKSYFSAS
jgi:hypothetical protein